MDKQTDNDNADATITYTGTLTHVGKQYLANAIAGKDQLVLSQMGVGDGGGAPVVPDEAQTALINECWRAQINRLYVDTRNSNIAVAELLVPVNVGGFWIREVGLYSEDGTLVAVTNAAESYKPLPAEGTSRSQVIRMPLKLSDTAIVTLEASNNITLVTTDEMTQEISREISDHEKTRNHPDATLTEKGFTQLSSATNSDNETMAATPKAVKAAMDNANTRMAKDQNGADIPDKPSFIRNVGLQDTVNRASHVNPSDGDLYGSIWGGWLSSYISRNTPSPTDLRPYATTSWVNAYFADKSTASKSGNGWFKDASTGLMIQWGTTAGGTGTGNISLPVPFPNAALWVLGWVGGALGYGDDDWSNSAGIVDRWTIRVTTDHGWGTAWIAIGY